MFEFPALRYPEDTDAARLPLTNLADGGVYRPMIRLRMARPGTAPGDWLWLKVRIDSGADQLLFPEVIAERLGLTRTSDSPVIACRSASGIAFQSWIAQVDLHLGEIGDRFEYDWTARVAFVPRPADDAARTRGVTPMMGIAGGLEMFLRTELELTPAEGRFPRVRIYTP